MVRIIFYVVVIFSMLMTSLSSLGFDPGPLSGTNGEIRTLALQPDGKILIGGFFTEVRGVQYFHIARLNSDGTLDRSFDPGRGPNNAVSKIVLQSDGKILIAGRFTEISGVSNSYVARLNANGTIDNSFSLGLEAGSREDLLEVSNLVLQPNGKIFITRLPRNLAMNPTKIRQIIRLNTDGSVDGSFNTDTIDGSFEALTLQPDGKLLVGGDFLIEGSVSRRNIVRLNADGNIDSTFNVSLNQVTLGGAPIPIGPNGTVFAIALQSNGQILIGGSFSFPQEPLTALAGIVRLDVDGRVDRSFLSFFGTRPGVRNIVVRPDGRILALGRSFGSRIRAPRIERNNIARLFPNGVLDIGFEFPGFLESFLPIPTFRPEGIFTLALQPDGKIVIGGHFPRRARVTNKINGIARLNVDGSFDSPVDLCFPVKNANESVTMICL